MELAVIFFFFNTWKLIDGTLERDYTKATNASVHRKSPWKCLWKYVSLNCTMSRDVWKKTYLTGPFIQHSTHFWLGFLGLFLDGEVQNCTPVITFDRDMLQPQKSSRYTDHHKFFQKLLKRVCWHQQFS